MKLTTEVFDSDGTLAVQLAGQDVAHVRWTDRKTAEDEFAEEHWRVLTDAERQEIIDRICSAIGEEQRIIIYSGGGYLGPQSPVPPGIVVEIRDYDVPDDWDEEDEGCRYDEDGDRYQFAEYRRVPARARGADVLSLPEAQELHDLIGAAIECEDYAGLRRARELAAVLVSDAIEREELGRPPAHLADAWSRFQEGEEVSPSELRYLDEWRADVAQERGEL